MLTTTITIAICAALFVGAFFLSEYVVKKQHRVHVLEDAYKEATEHIHMLEQEKQTLEQTIEHMQYEAQLNGQRMDRPRAWNPGNPLNSQERQ